jgi:hypothetical protein
MMESRWDSNPVASRPAPRTQARSPAFPSFGARTPLRPRRVANFTRFQFADAFLFSIGCEPGRFSLRLRNSDRFRVRAASNSRHEAPDFRLFGGHRVVRLCVYSVEPSQFRHRRGPAGECLLFRFEPRTGRRECGKWRDGAITTLVTFAPGQSKPDGR